MSILYPKNPEVITKGDKVYISNMKVMNAHDLFEKDGQITKIRGNKFPPPIGWFASEKLDGIRAIWNGKDFVSRGSGNGMPKVFSYVPEWVLKLMPKDIPLDGELWIGRGKFNEISSISNRIPNKNFPIEKLNKLWETVTYMVYDIPNLELNFFNRLCQLETRLSKLNSKFIKLVPQTVITSIEQFENLFMKITSKGGEGVMLKFPDSLYELKRSKLLLKYKIKDDAEGVVIGHKEGTGRLTGTLGALEIQVIKDNKLTNIITNIGSGFTDAQRTLDKKSPAYIPLGSIVSFSYMEMTKDSVRHPIFRGFRYDINYKK